MTHSTHDSIAAALGRLAALARSNENRRASEEGLSPLQARALVALRRRPGQRLGELADELLVTYGTLSAAISSLEGKQLVRKDTDPKEHRAVVLGLTRRGASAARRIEGWAGELVAGAVDDLPAGAAGELLTSLLGLIRALEERGEIAAARMCPTCRHFRPGSGGRGDGPYCGLLDEPLSAESLRVDCADHEPPAA